MKNIRSYCLNCNSVLQMDKRQYGGLCSVLCETEYCCVKQTYFKLWPESGSDKNTCTVEAKEIESILADADEPYCVFPVKMTKAEFFNLPEFKGF